MMSKHTADFDAKFEDTLNGLARRGKTSPAKVIQAAVATYKVLKDEESEGRRIESRNVRSGSIRPVLIP
jgi:hypothetical protein